jgi:hypothetical protein
MKHAYKNDVANIHKIVRDKEASAFWVGLTGGNPEVKGTTVVKAVNVTSNCESGYFPMLQKLSKQNAALLECALGKGTVTMFMVDVEDENKAIYLGCYYLAGFETHEEDIETLRDTARKYEENYIPASQGMLTRFQERLHVRVKALPYTLPEENDEDVWRKIVVEESDVFPIGIETGETTGQPAEILSLSGDKSVSFAEVVTKFLDDGLWNDLPEKDIETSDDVTGQEERLSPGKGDVTGQEERLSPGKGFYIEMKEFWELMVCIAVGVFCRLQQMNVVSAVAVAPLRNDTPWFKKLGSTIQTFASPHPGRVYDTTPLALIVYSNSQGKGRAQRNGLSWMKVNPKETKELMFAAIVATTTGRMGAFYQWSMVRRSFKPASCVEFRGKSIFFPKISDTDDFIDFLQKTSKDGKMGSFISGQFRQSLPPCVLNVDSFGSFIKEVANDMDTLYNNMIEKLESEEPCSKEQLLDVLKAFLLLKMTDGKHTAFVASQILYNIDEMIDLIPDKAWDTVEMGFGSKEGMCWLVKNGPEDNMETLRRIQKEVTRLSKDQLDCLGLEKVTKNRRARVFWKINLRWYDLHDAEHGGCKLWYYMVRKVGARPSKNPKLHRPHLHPLKVHKMEVDKFYCDEVLSIAKCATSKFQEEASIKIPGVFVN